MKLTLLAALIFATCAPAFAASNEDRFNALPAPGATVIYTSNDGEPVVDTNYVERTDAQGLICMQTWPAGNGAHNYTYACYVKALDGPGAQSAFNAINGAEYKVNFYVGGKIVAGLTTKERIANNGFCRSVTPVVPNAVTTYACYGGI